MSAFEMDLTQGQVHVLSVQMVVDDLNAKVWHLDLETKHPEVWTGNLSLGAGRNDVHVHLTPTKASKNVDYETEETTALVIPLPDFEYWFLLTDAVDYTVRIVLYRMHPVSLG